MPLAAHFPPTTEFLLSSKSGNRFTDFIYTVTGVILASQRAWELMKAEGVTDAQVEYLPFVLKDRKVACFDFDKSKYKRLTSDPNKFAGISRLQILPEKVPEDAKLFRLAEDPDVNLMRTDLLEKLQGAGMEGLRGIALGELLE